jgi:hypothetical protein
MAQMPGTLSNGYAITSHVRHDGYLQGTQYPFTPIGAFISYLFQKLSWEDPICRDLADYYRLVQIAGPGSGGQRLWPVAGIYSDEVRLKCASGQCTNGHFDEWSLAIV